MTDYFTHLRSYMILCGGLFLYIVFLTGGIFGLGCWRNAGGQCEIDEFAISFLLSPEVFATAIIFVAMAFAGAGWEMAGQTKTLFKKNCWFTWGGLSAVLVWGLAVLLLLVI